jgi:ketosteroid isomerase-like protein
MSADAEVEVPSPLVRVHGPLVALLDDDRLRRSGAGSLGGLDWEIRTISANGRHERATQPEDLGRFFVERANEGDVDGLVALYEPDAVLAFPSGQISIGHQAIRRVYQQLLADRPTFAAGGHQPALRNGDLALTSTRLPGGGATAEVARQQPDGTWLWVIDQPNFLG